MCKDVFKYGVNVREFNEQHWEFIRNLSKTEQQERNKKGNGGAYGIYKCKHCKTKVERRKDGFKTRVFICPNECNGSRHGRARVVKGFNDLATTNPEMIKFLVNKEDAYLVTSNSTKKIKLKCPNCEKEKIMSLNRLYCYGICCSFCSDGISFPEKFVAGILNQLGFQFKKEYSLDKGKTRYDFYIPSVDTIIEVHGIQHYNGGFETCNSRSLEKEQKNDKYKKNLAIVNNVGNYVVIDARYSRLEWIKNSVLNSELTKLLNFDEKDIEWIKLVEDCEKSLVKEVCNYYNRFGDTPLHISKKFGVSDTTIRNYLKKGASNGWCVYNDEIKRVNALKATAKKVRGVKDGKDVTFSSVREASRWVLKNGLSRSKTPHTNISACCLGKCKSAYGYVWSYIDDTEETDNQTQAS